MKVIRVLLIIVFAFSLVNAQDKVHGDKRKREKKIEQLEKLKLGEVLEMDENTSVKFFARRCDQKKKQEALMVKRDSLLEFLEKKINEGASDKIYNELTSKVIEVEKRIFSERESFLKSLSDLLPPEKIAKLVLFEYKFRQEIHDYLIEHRKNLQEK